MVIRLNYIRKKYRVDYATCPGQNFFDMNAELLTRDLFAFANLLVFNRIVKHSSPRLLANFDRKKYMQLLRLW